MIKKLRETWKMLNTSIYAGKRLENNLNALTAAGIITSLLSLVLMVMDFKTGQTIMFIAAVVTLVFGAACAYYAGVKKNRNVAVIFPTLFCAVAFTIYTLTGAGHGSALFWTLLLPVGISYFVSVKYGVLLSAYYAVLFFVLFYTPLKAQVAMYYSQELLSRFPLLFVGNAILTLIAMVQYHRGVLFENAYTDHLNAEVEKQTKIAVERGDRLEKFSDELVQTLAVAIDAKDRYTNGHSFRVSQYSVALFRKMGEVTLDEIKALEREALLHDIGKIGIPDSVLNKPGRLDKDEFAVIQSHAAIGGRILSNSTTLLSASKVARHHHERYDGRGYPDGLAGEEIPLHARIVSIADAYDAMHSERIYRKALPRETIRNEMINGKGKQFDPALLDVFLQLFDDGTLDKVEREAMAEFDISRIVSCT